MTEHRYVESLPDLISPNEYAAHPDGALVRLRITVSERGVEVLGDAMRPEHIESTLTAAGLDGIEQMLCG